MEKPEHAEIQPCEILLTPIFDGQLKKTNEVNDTQAQEFPYFKSPHKNRKQLKQIEGATPDKSFDNSHDFSGNGPIEDE